MKLLIITQKADQNDPILGFFHRWIEEFARHFDKVTVICLEKGVCALPPNVSVFSLGKEGGKGSMSRFAFVARFYRLLWDMRREYDVVFVHMNPIYVVLGGVAWRLMRKPVSLWYTHKSVDLKLRIAAALTDKIFTASAHSFGLSSPKVVVTGHGIDAAAFAAAGAGRRAPASNELLRIIQVGRITPIKGCHTLIEAAAILKDEGREAFSISFVGEPVTAADRAYAAGLEQRIAELGLGDVIRFDGALRPADMPARYARADIAVNPLPTGGVDKAALESMAAGIPTLSSNEAFHEYFGSLAGDLMFAHGDATELANRIIALSGGSRAAQIGANLQRTALERADVSALIARLSRGISSLRPL